MIRSVNASFLPLSSAPPVASYDARVGIPVLKSQALYANFKHVFGVPREDGISINRLQILNAVIDRLSALKKDPSLSALARRESDVRDDASMDALILRFEKEIRAEAAKPALPYRPSASLPSAIAVDVLA